MKHLDDYKIFEGKIPTSKEEIDAICSDYDIKNYTINKDGSIDVNGNVNLHGQYLWELPLRFNRVSGYFYCSNNHLTSLKGSPKYVGGGFGCSGNKLTSLEGCPEQVDGSFFCLYNQLTSLEGCTEHIRGVFNCESNPIYSIVRWFIHRKDRDNLVELFNYYDIIQDRNVIYDRLKYFYETIGMPSYAVGLPHIFDGYLKDIEKKGYKIIY